MRNSNSAFKSPFELVSFWRHPFYQTSFQLMEEYLKLQFWYSEQLLCCILLVFLNVLKSCSFHVAFEFWKTGKFVKSRSGRTWWLSHMEKVVLVPKLLHKPWSLLDPLRCDETTTLYRFSFHSLQ